ncbi:MAG: metallophosphoesterase [Bacteroidetes bacterium]|nr:metallophosphoesterase [Bacteroidota bacterium]
MLKKILKAILTRPVTWLANRVSSAPKKDRVMKALSELYQKTITSPGKKGLLIPFDPQKQSLIIFSDEHKGTRNGADNFAVCEKNYMTALDYYNEKNFYFINMGDCEELWENTIFGLMKHNKDVFAKEKLFIERKAYCKIFGNHDLFWDNDPLASVYLRKIYGEAVKIYTGVVLRTPSKDGGHADIFCTHGHQGDAQSDGNAFSKWFVSYVWGPLQIFLEINTNTPATNDNDKTLHNLYMYEWSAEQKNVILITGHTHQPVFCSLTHLERLYLNLEEAHAKNDQDAIAKIESEIPRRRREYDFVNNSFRNMKASYFNSGCCCFDDGTITGIEISEGNIRLIKWSTVNGQPTRIVAEESVFNDVVERIANYKKG